MAKNDKKDIVIAGGMAICAYLLFFRMGRSKAISILNSFGITDPKLNDPLLYSNTHLVKWAKALQSGKLLYQHNGKTYSVMPVMNGIILDNLLYIG